MFNGILTGQCNEIVQYSDKKEYAVCNLASISLKSFIVPFIQGNREFVIYSLPKCKFCDYAKKYLQSNNMKYKVIQATNEIMENVKR
jgi:D-alanine-D-alanine ligase-like ATP-grasp enzyme